MYVNVTPGLSSEPVYVVDVYSSSSIASVNVAFLISNVISTVPSKFLIPSTVTVAVPAAVLFAYVTLNSSAVYVFPLYVNVTPGLISEPV